MCVCVEQSFHGAMSVASVVVMELCTVTHRYLDIEAAVAGLYAVFFLRRSSSQIISSFDL